MRFDLITLFPEMCDRVLDESILGRARRAGKVAYACHNFRDFAGNKHNRVDDSPYGGGMGMLLQAEPIYQCYAHLVEELGARPHVIFMSPQGRPFDQQKAIELSQRENLLLLCGHYEGVDQRVLDEIVDEEISVGDFVLTGGELGALVVVDAVSRLCPGVLSEEECFTEESHYNGLLEYPQYTRPPIWRGRQVPGVLLEGKHAGIARWRREQSLAVTRQKRPDLLARAELSREDRIYLAQLEQMERDRASSPRDTTEEE